jgi:hypothetical protein
MKSKQLYNDSRHLSSEELLRFSCHEMPAEEENSIRRHLENCELCSDALKGVAEMQDAMGIFNIMYDLRKNMRHKLVPKKKILYRFELITILISFFIVGLILFLGYYFLIFRR